MLFQYVIYGRGVLSLFFAATAGSRPLELLKHAPSMFMLYARRFHRAGGFYEKLTLQTGDFRLPYSYALISMSPNNLMFIGTVNSCSRAISMHREGGLWRSFDIIRLKTIG